MTDIENQTPLPMAKILFQPNDGYYTSTEGLWAEVLGEDRYRIRNSPWYIYGISFEDVVRALPNEEGALEFVEVVERSGSSTFRVLLNDGVDEAQFERYWRPLGALGCTRERAKGGFYAIDAPSGVDLEEVAALLRIGKADAVWEWETGYWHDTAAGGHPDAASATDQS